MISKGSVVLSRSRLMVALLVFFLGGAVPGQLAQQIANPNGLATPTLRVGTIVGSPEQPTSSYAWVEMADGEDPIQMPLSAGYIPVVGDQVNVLFLAANGSAQGLILSGRSGQAGNVVLNSHFTRSPRLGGSGSNPPYHWSVLTLSGQAPAVTTSLGGSTGLPYVSLYDSPSSGAADHVFYSAAIPVTPGQVYGIEISCEAFVTPGTTTLTSYVAWLSMPSQTWDQAESTTSIATDSDTLPYVPQLGGEVTVPDGITHMRIGIRNASTAAGYITDIGAVEAHLLS